MYKFWSEYIATNKELSVLDISGFRTVEEYVAWCMNPTARNRWRFANKHYASDILSRNNYLEDIYEINTSAETRQGKPMREAYKARQEPIDESIKCEQHHSVFIACRPVNNTAKCVAYITAQICGELFAVTQIIGHADYLKDGVMLQVFATAVAYAISIGKKAIVYSKWKDGTDGLRHWKYSVGLQCAPLSEK